MGLVKFLSNLIKEKSRLIEEEQEVRQRESSRLFRELKRQTVLSEIDIQKPLKELEEGLVELGDIQTKEELESIGYKVDLSSREVVMKLTLILAYSNDFGCDSGYHRYISHIYNKAIDLMQNASEFFKKYSNLGTSNSFSDYATTRLARLTDVAHQIRPELNRERIELIRERILGWKD